jgi:hypothetical protein
MEQSKPTTNNISELEDELLNRIESIQHLLSTLETYINNNTSQLDYTSTLSIVLAIHDHFSTADRSLLEKRIQHQFALVKLV